MHSCSTSKINAHSNYWFSSPASGEEWWVWWRWMPVSMWHAMIAFVMAAAGIAYVLKMHPTSIECALKQATAAKFNWYSKWGALVWFVLCCSWVQFESWEIRKCHHRRWPNRRVCNKMFWILSLNSKKTVNGKRERGRERDRDEGRERDRCGFNISIFQQSELIEIMYAKHSHTIIKHKLNGLSHFFKMAVLHFANES